MPKIFITHASKDDLAAEALRTHLVNNGWPRSDLFLDHSVEGIGAHQLWKDALGEANSAANAIICLASPDWLDSKESQVERRVAETLASLDRHRTRAVLIAIWRDLDRKALAGAGLGDYHTVNLGAAGERRVIRASLSAKTGADLGRQDDVSFSDTELAKLVRALREIGAAPDAFPWTPRDPAHPSPYPGLEAFQESEAGVFFGRDARIAEAVGEIEALARSADAPRLYTILAPSGVGKSSFLRAGLWPRLKQRDGIAPLAIVRPSGGIVSGRAGGFIHTLAGWFRFNGQSVDAATIRDWLGNPVTPEGVARTLSQVPRISERPRTLLIGIDQGEELFATLDPREAAEASAFLDAMLALIAAPPARLDLMLVVTIRADSYDPFADRLKQALDRATTANAPRLAALREASLTLEPMSDTAFRDVITRPAKIARKTERDVFAPTLVDHLVKTFTGGDALPLLALTLEQLFDDHHHQDQITLNNYRAQYGDTDGPQGPVQEALSRAYAIAGRAGTEENLRRLLIPALATWDDKAGATGAAKRRIAPRAVVVRDDPDLKALADALIDKHVRLLVCGNSTAAGATPEIAHEALLRIDPVVVWITETKNDLRLRDDLIDEANTHAKAVGAGDAVAIDKAIAARRGPRLEEALTLVGKPEFADVVIAGSQVATYLATCEAHETAERNKQRRIIGRAFVKPSQKALEDGLSDQALRLAAAGVLLANDMGFDPRVDTQLLEPALRAIYENRTRLVLHGHTRGLASALFSPDGQRIVTVSDDRSARIWDAATGRLVAALEGHTSTSVSASFNPDSQRIVTVTSDKSARIWDVATGQEIADLKGYTGWGWHWRALFSPDGRRIVTTSGDWSARIWDAATGQQIAALEGHTGEVVSASFNPDGQRIVTASDDKIARIWNAATGQHIATLEGHTGRLVSALFSPDGQQIVTASDDKSARIWDGSRGAAFTCARPILLTAALANGIGWQMPTDAADLLMWDAPENLYAGALAQLGRGPDDQEIAEVAASLRAPFHPNCYLSPTQLAKKSGAARQGAEFKVVEKEVIASDAAVASSAWHKPTPPPSKRRWWQWPRKTENHGQRATVVTALAAMPVDAPIRILTGSQAFEDRLAAYEAENTAVLKAQRTYKRWGGVALSLATLATLIAAATLLPISALIPLEAERVVSGLQAVANIVALVIVWWLSRAGAIDRWLTTRASAERLRGKLFADLLAAPDPPGTAPGKLWPQKLALFSAAHVDYQRRYLASAARKHTKAAAGLSWPRTLALAATGISIIVGACAFFGVWPQQLLTLMPWLELAEEPIRWQLGLGTLASGLLAYASARTLIHQDERNAALYRHTCERLDELATAQSKTAADAAARGDGVAVIDYAQSAQAILDADYTAWQFHRPPRDPVGSAPGVDL